MREIKFRAWDNVRKLMHYPDELWVKKDNEWNCVNRVNGFGVSETDNLNGELMQYTGLKGYEKDIIDVCIFLVSPSNPDNDQHFRGVIEFENGKFVFIIHKYLKFDGNKSEWINICAKDLPFYDEELDEDGTYTVPYFDFLAMSSNLGEFNDDNVEIIGNIYQNPELLTN